MIAQMMRIEIDISTIPTSPRSLLIVYLRLRGFGSNGLGEFRRSISSEFRHVSVVVLGICTPKWFGCSLFPFDYGGGSTGYVDVAR
jgi:hypothetical protein